MRRCRLFALVSLLALNLPLAVRAAEPLAPIPLWPGQAPGEKGDIGPEQELPPRTPDDTIRRVTDVTAPTITVYRPAADKNTGAAVVICPGGGYHLLAIAHEGVEVADWLNSLGVTGVVLKYRVPSRKGLEKYTAALQDAQRAISLVRQHASEWGVAPDRIGMLGFSAGGHLSAAASNNFDARTYEPIDDADRVSCRPDFAVLIYPGGLIEKKAGPKPDAPASANGAAPHGASAALPALSPEMRVSSNTPPTFLAMTEDDGAIDGALFYYLALKNAKVPAEMHLYPKGGHGYGLRPSANTVSTWPARAADWMRTLGVLDNAK